MRERCGRVDERRDKRGGTTTVAASHGQLVVAWVQHECTVPRQSRVKIWAPRSVFTVQGVTSSVAKARSCAKLPDISVALVEFDWEDSYRC